MSCREIFHFFAFLAFFLSNCRHFFTKFAFSIIKSKHLEVVKRNLNVRTGGFTPTNSHNDVINRLLDFSVQIFPVR